MERSILKLPLSKLCAIALCSTEQSTFRGGEKGEKVPRKGEEGGWPAKGAKRKKGRVKTGQILGAGETTITKIKFALVKEGGGLGGERRIVQKRCFFW